MPDVFDMIPRVWVMEQHPKEIRSFAWFLREHWTGGAVVELGVRHGGTSALWHQLLPDAPVVIGVDRVGADSYQEPEFSQRARDMEAQFPRFRFVEGDTATSQTRLDVYRALGAHTVGFLFIDADHAYDAVKRDYDRFGPMVRPGGLIAFHDIVDSPRTGGGVAQFWNEVKRTHTSTHEFITTRPASDWGGIGAVIV